MFIVLCELINIYLKSKEMAYINIFISHSSADKALVRAVVEILGNNGITVMNMSLKVVNAQKMKSIFLSKILEFFVCLFRNHQWEKIGYLKKSQNINQ